MAIVFGYAFPHRKTAEGLYRLKAHGVQIDYVIAAPFRKLNLRKTVFNESLRTTSLRPPVDICSDLAIRYVELPHESPEAIRLINETKPERGVILGARILPEAVIRGFSEGILNLHPGLLPHNAGLHNIEWAINHNLPQGATAHLIDDSVDGGLLLRQSVLEVMPEGFRIRDLQATLSELEMQLAATALTDEDSWERRALQKLEDRKYHRPLSARAEVLARVKWPGYVRGYPKIVDNFVNARNSGKRRASS